MTLTPTLKERFEHLIALLLFHATIGGNTVKEVEKEADALWQWIEDYKDKAVVQSKSKIVEQILGMECMQDEYWNRLGGYSDDKINSVTARNQLRLQIKEEINKL